MKFIKNKKGYTEAELMMVFALLALFGILCFTLIQAGGGAYERLADNRSNKSYARVALSYIENRVRQGDSIESLFITDNPFEDGDALVISGITGIEGEELWILQKESELVEYYINAGDDINPDAYFSIADVESFSVAVKGDTVELVIGYLQNGEEKTQTRIITLRSGGGDAYE